MITDPIADMLIRIQNAVIRGKSDVVVPVSKAKKKIAEILASEGYLENVEISKCKIGNFPEMKLTLKYLGSKSVLNGVKRVSRPGQRVYVGYKDISKVKSGLGIGIISTSKGIMTGQDARKSKCGGEFLFYVW